MNLAMHGSVGVGGGGGGGGGCALRSPLGSAPVNDMSEQLETIVQPLPPPYANDLPQLPLATAIANPCHPLLLHLTADGDYTLSRLVSHTFRIQTAY